METSKTIENKVFSEEKLNTILRFLQQTKEGVYTEVGTVDNNRLGINRDTSEELQYFYSIR